MSAKNQNINYFTDVPVFLIFSKVCSRVWFFLHTANFARTSGLHVIVKNTSYILTWYISVDWSVRRWLCKSGSFSFPSHPMLHNKELLLILPDGKNIGTLKDIRGFLKCYRFHLEAATALIPSHTVNLIYYVMACTCISCEIVYLSISEGDVKFFTQDIESSDRRYHRRQAVISHVHSTCQGTSTIINNTGMQFEQW